MELVLERVNLRENDTLGKLFINGEYFCDTLECKDRGLTQDMSEKEIKKIKIQGQTAIPKGTYKMSLDIVSPRYSKSPFYSKVSNGKLPRLLEVKGFEGILIHCGNYVKDTRGCILIGRLQEDGKFLFSSSTYMKLWPRLQEDPDNLTITIK